MANIDDVAKLAGVSTATVSAVLNGQNIVKPQTRRRVTDAICKLNYHPNLYARSLARGRSAMLGLVISDIINPFFSDIAQVVQTEANRHGYQVFISATQFSLERLKAAVRYLIGMRADGIIIMTTEMDDEVLASIRGRRIPVIFEDAGTVDRTTSNLRIDYEGGIFSAVRCLVEMGHRDMLYVENPPAPIDRANLLSLRIREDAFLTAAQSFPGVRTFRVAVPGPPLPAGIQAAAEALAKYPFTAAVVNADPIALGFLRGLRRAGCRVPHDVSVIGFDNSPGCEYTDPPLSSVSIPRETVARVAVENLAAMIERQEPGREIHIPTELILRESVARPPQIPRTRTSAQIEQPGGTNEAGDADGKSGRRRRRTPAQLAGEPAHRVSGEHE